MTTRYTYTALSLETEFSRLRSAKGSHQSPLRRRRASRAARRVS